MTTKENPVETAIDLCREQVRRDDYPRYALSLFAPAAEREYLWAVLALNQELKKIPVSVNEPMMGLIRYQWWRDAINDVFSGQTLHHPVLRSLSHVRKTSALLIVEDLHMLIEAYENFFKTIFPMNLQQFCDHKAAIGYVIGRLMESGEINDAGIGAAYEITASMIDIPRLWIHGQLILPDMENIGELARTRLTSAQLDARLQPAMRQVEKTVLTLLPDRKKPQQNRLLKLIQIMTLKNMYLLKQKAYNVISYQQHKKDYRLVLYLVIKRWTSR